MTGLVCLPMTLPPRTPSISRGVFCAETGADHADARMCARLVISGSPTPFASRGKNKYLCTIMYSFKQKFVPMDVSSNCFLGIVDFNCFPTLLKRLEFF
jgi:hypothetical protein